MSDLEKRETERYGKSLPDDAYRVEPYQQPGPTREEMIAEGRKMIAALGWHFGEDGEPVIDDLSKFPQPVRKLWKKVKRDDA